LGGLDAVEIRAVTYVGLGHRREMGVGREYFAQWKDCFPPAYVTFLTEKQRSISGVNT
jgi:hypothetical protein